MASFDLITFDSTAERKKKRASSGLTIDFTTVQVGASTLPITEGTSGNITIGGVKLEGVATPTAGTDAANKDYVDGVAQGLDVKHSAKAATTTALPTVTAAGSSTGKTLTATANGVLTIDGVSTWTDIDNDSGSDDPFATGVTRASRVLVKDQASPDDNGLYAVKDKGSAGTPFVLVRATDFDSNADITAGAFTFIEEGTTHSDAGFVLTTDDPVIVDVTGQTWAQFSGAGSFSGGDGINISGTVIEVDLSTASGLEFATGELQVDLAAAGAGTGGLTLTGNEIEVDPGLGIELTAAGVAVDLEAAGAGTGGLTFNGNEIRINVNDGLELTGSGLAVDLATDPGLEFSGGDLRVLVDVTETLTTLASAVRRNSSGLSVAVDDATIEGSGAGAAGAENLRVKAGGIGITHIGTGIAGDGLSGGGGAALSVNVGDGLEIASDTVQVDLATDPGLEFSGGDLRVLVDITETLTTLASAVRRNSGGLSVAVDDSTIEGSGAGAAGAESLRVKAGGIGITHIGTGIAGDGLSGGGGAALSVNVGDGLEIASDTVQVDLATDPGLEFSGGDLRVLVDITETLTTLASAVRRNTGGLSVAVDDSTIEGSGAGAAGAENLRVKASGITETQLNTSVAGDGLAGGGGTALSVSTGDGIQIVSDAVAADYSDAFTNDNAGAITIRQVVYIKADGDVDLAKNDITDLDNFELGVVEDASIASTASGQVYIRRGAVIPGYTGLTPGAKQYVSDSTAGAMVENLSGFVAGEFVYTVGRAKSATELIFDPYFEFEF